MSKLWCYKVYAGLCYTTIYKLTKDALMPLGISMLKNIFLFHTMLEYKQMTLVISMLNNIFPSQVSQCDMLSVIMYIIVYLKKQHLLINNIIFTINICGTLRPLGI